MAGILQGKTVVVTGSTRGLGLGIAHACAEEGAAVVIASRSAQAVTRAVKELRDSGAQASGIPCDVGTVADVEALAAHALQTFGQFDVWVNNAGLSAPYGPTAQIPAEAFERVVQTNILGTYHGSVVALRHFLPRHSGKLINLLGRGDKKSVPLQNAYASSKMWVRTFTMALAQEYKDSGVGIYAFNPGLVLTEMLSDTQAIAGYEACMAPLRTVMRLWGNPPEVPARKLVWLASAATDGRTGLNVQQLGTLQIVSGLLRDWARRLTGRQMPPVDMRVTTVPPATSGK
jgi:glucose 1-dehydrogenase